MSSPTDDGLNLSENMADVEVAGKKPLNWFDVSSIGSSEMICNLSWGWIVFIAALYGLKWTIIGFIGGLVVILAAWWLYREMITAVPEPGMLQSYGREAKMFSLGTSYLLLYVPVYTSFMWMEFGVASGLMSTLIPPVPSWLWPIILIAPIVFINLMGHQITGKLQSTLVAIILIGDVIVGGAIWMAFDLGVWKANWAPPTPIGWITFFGVTGLWLAIMAGVLEVQQVVVDEWREFEKSRDGGLLFGSFQLAATQAILGFGIMALFPIQDLAAMPIPPVGAVGEAFGTGILYVGILIFAIASTFTTFSVFFMAMGKILALYSMQGALPRIFAKYSVRAVPWFSILFLTVIALIGAYWLNWQFIAHMLAMWSATLYIVVPLFFLGMRRNKNLERPYKAPYGTAVAIFLIIFASLIGISIIVADPIAALVWFALVAAIVLYDHYVVPRTARGSHYRKQVLRSRTNAARLE